VTPTKSSVEARLEAPAPIAGDPLCSSRFVQGPGVVTLANLGFVGMACEVSEDAGDVLPGVEAL